MNQENKNEPVIDGDEILEGVLRWVEIESPSHIRLRLRKWQAKTGCISIKRRFNSARIRPRGGR